MGNVLALVDSSERSHSPGTCILGLGNAKRCAPAVREMNVRACSHQENHLLSRCKEEGYAKTISFVNLQTKLLSRCKLVGWPFRMRFWSTVINMHTTCAKIRAAFAGAGAAMAVDYDCWRSRFCDAQLHRFAFDFFDSHFFALRFAVVSQCPEFDSELRCETG